MRHERSRRTFLRTRTSYLFCLKDIPQLYAAHCAVSDFHVSHESRVLRLETEFGGNAADYVPDGMKQEFLEFGA
jgi:hypothetical protein